MPERRFRLQRDDGERLVISVQVAIAFGADDRPERLFGTVQDITEREAMNQDLRERLHELTRWQAVILGREDRIRELKQEVNELLREQGEAPRYATGGEAK
jgi:predicted ArsR family transcriptional regulator